MSFNRPEYKYVSPLKSTKMSTAITPTIPKKTHPTDLSPNFSRQTERSISPLNPSRRDSMNVSELMKLNEKLVEEADYWHRRAVGVQPSQPVQDKFSDQDIKRLISLCEAQAVELKQIREKQQQQSTAQPIHGYSTIDRQQQKNFGLDLQEQNRNIDSLHQQIQLLQNQIAKQKIYEENYKRDVQKLTEEAAKLQKALNQAQKERNLQNHAREAITSQQLDAIQQTHMNQLRILNEQISSLQQEIVHKVEQNEQLQNDLEQVLAENRYLQENEDKIQQQLQEATEHNRLLQEDKQREIKYITQTKDQQLSQMSKMNNDLRLQMSNKIQQLEQQLRDTQIEASKHKNENSSFTVQLQDLDTQIKIYQENMDQFQKKHIEEMEAVHEDNNQQIECIKETYQRQLDQLIEELEKLQNALSNSNGECERQKQAVDQLTSYLENAEVNENELLKELENWKNKYEELEHHCQQEIQRLDESNLQYTRELQQAHDQKMRQVESQMQSYKQIIETRMKESEDYRFQKNDLQRKITDSNVTIQMLQNEIEALKNKFFEQQRQSEVEEQVREEIKRSQNEQIRRQFEVQMDQLENENRNLQFLLDGKSRECEEWKNSYLRGRNTSVQI